MLVSKKELIEKVYTEQLEHLIRFEVDKVLWEMQLSPNDTIVRSEEEVKKLKTDLAESVRQFQIKSLIVEILQRLYKIELKKGKNAKNAEITTKDVMSVRSENEAKKP